MARFDRSALSRGIAALATLGIGLGLAAAPAGAQRFSLGTSTSSLQNQPFTPHSSTPVQTVLTATVAPSVETAEETVTSAGDYTAGEVTSGEILSETPSRLIVNGGDLDAPVVVDATPRSFADWDSLFTYAQSELGATLIRDDDGLVVAATGQYAVSGSVVFDDGGDEFESLDYVASHLGGISGEIEVGGEIHSLHGAPGNGTVSYLAQTASDCSSDGDSCIEGHSWLTHAVIYHSVGARTKQTSGGFETVTTWGCSSGVAVYHEGVRQCRYRNPGAWEWDPEARALVPTLDGIGEDLYLYGPLVPSSYQALRNQLRVGARVFVGPNAPQNLEPAIVQNQPEAELGDWTLMRNVLPDEFGNLVPLSDITGVCASHSGSRGEFVRTSDGSTGDDDVLCDGGVPY